MNVLIAFYSWSGNTARLAELIQKETGGDLFEIRPAVPYPGSYNDCVNQVKREIQAGYRPELEELPNSMEQYGTVFVGSPNWWSTISPPVAAFLERVSLSGKTVIPFCTHGGGGQARCASDTAALCGGSSLLEGLVAYGGGGSAQDVARWLERIGVK